METLLKKVLGRQVKVGILGMGYVGLPLAIEMGRAGLTVVGFDVDPAKIAQLKDGRSYVGDVPDAAVRALVAEGRLIPSLDPADLASVDAVSICVPTPLNKTKDPDISFVMDAANTVASILHKDMLVVLESTTYPGTTRDLVLPLFETRGFKVGEDFCLCFSPERVDPGNPVWNIQNTPKLIGGITDTCTAIGRALYSLFIDRVVPLRSTQVAEMAKLLENTFRAVNIALVNELAIMCHKLGVDVWEAIQAASTKPFGFMPFYPGPGLGGHCIPVDPLYLSWAMRSLNYNARFIELASEVNASMPEWVVSRVADALNDVGKPMNGSRILVLGVAYKRDIADVRESPALDIIDHLAMRKALVSYSDPFVPSVRVGERAYASVPVDDATLATFDCAVMVTDHSAFDVDRIVSRVPILMDTRNVSRSLTRNLDRVRKL